MQQLSSDDDANILYHQINSNPEYKTANSNSNITNDEGEENQNCEEYFGL